MDKPWNPRGVDNGANRRAVRQLSYAWCNMIGVSVEASEASEPVGRVLGTADATPLQFWTAVTPGSYLQLDDVVVTSRELPDREPVTIAGVVTQVRARHEGAQFDSDVFAIAEGTLPALVQEAAEITTTRVDPELYVPPAPGAVVHRATGAARDAALHFDRMERRVPMGTGRDGVPVFLNADFLDGTRGAHVSISGISGRGDEDELRDVPALLGVPLRRARRRRGQRQGADLQRQGRGPALPRPPQHQARRGDHRGVRKLRRCPRRPFPDVRVYAPPRAGDSSGAPDVSSRLTGVDSFYWTLEEFCADRLLPYVFADADDERQQYTMVVHSVTAHLARYAVPAEGGISIDGRRLGSYGDLVDHVVDQLTDDETRSTWAGSAVNMGTVNAFARRLIGSKSDLARLIRGDLAARRPHGINTAESAQVTVVDLHNLPDRAQRFVVGVTLKTRVRAQGEVGHRPARCCSWSSTSSTSTPPARARRRSRRCCSTSPSGAGRSGVILIGAQQTASEVERRIVTNSAIRVVGRLDPAEASRPEYGFLPPAMRQRALLARPGTMFVNQPDIPVPLCVEFPFPAWATRSLRGRAAAVGHACARSCRAPTRSRWSAAAAGVADDDIPF